MEDWLISRIEPIEECIHRLFRNGTYKHLFTLSTFIYWLFYDKMEHSYISHIYSKDKYGVVITYGVITFINVSKKYFSQDVFYSRITRDPTTTESKMDEIMKSRTIYTIIALSKILVFNFIFKKHTDKERYHQVIHICFVGVLGILTIVSVALYHTMKIRVMVPRLVILSVSFQLLGWLSESLDFKNLLVNFLTMILECILVVETV